VQPERCSFQNTKFSRQLQFRIISAFAEKPLPNQGVAPEHTTARPDPFGNPEPDFVIAKTDSHLLQLNKFCALCPQLLLHPNNYAPQAEPLACDDFIAAWDILDRLGASQHISFYNCGDESGSSQPYRHIQIISTPSRDEFVFFPDTSLMRNHMQVEQIPSEPPSTLSVPFFCLVHNVATLNAKQVHVAYQEMLTSCERTLGQNIVAHNLVFTRDWLCVIPRKNSGAKHGPANSMGMMGMIWVATDDERNDWNVLGLSKHIANLGYLPTRSSREIVAS
jgi:ATP adenylyltransferase/5',5'''-P-1,P-4-tetraphosphate phosphorylase II